MLQDVAAAFAAREVEIAVVRQVDRRRLVGRRAVFQHQLVARRERAGDAGLQRARIAFLTIRARVREDDADAAVSIERLALPDDLVEPLVAAVQMVRAAVGREPDRGAVEREAALGNPVSIAPDDGAEVARFGEVRLERVEAEDDVVDASGAIRRAHRHDRRAVAHQADFDAVLADQREAVDRRAVGQPAEWGAGHGGGPRGRRDCERAGAGRGRVQMAPRLRLPGAGRH